MKKDLRQSGNYRQFMKQIGWMSVGIDASESSQRNYLYVKKLPLLGSFIKGLRLDWPVDFQAIEEIARKYRARWLKLSLNREIRDEKMVEEIMREHGYKIDSSPLIPTKTAVLDLNKSLDKVWQEMKKDCRYAIKKAEKNGLQIRTDGNIKKFSQEFHRWRWFYGLSPLIKPQEKEIVALRQTFGKDNCFNLLIVRDSGEGQWTNVLAGALFLKHQDSFHYWLAFTSGLGRKLMAQYLVVWEGIKLAKKMGAKVFDFEGVYDERFSKAFQSWKGFSHFKKSFGGKTLTYIQPYTR